MAQGSEQDAGDAGCWLCAPDEPCHVHEQTKTAVRDEEPPVELAWASTLAASDKNE